jgi:hypothetical protein
MDVDIEAIPQHIHILYIAKPNANLLDPALRAFGPTRQSVCIKFDMAFDRFAAMRHQEYSLAKHAHDWVFN